MIRLDCHVGKKIISFHRPAMKSSTPADRQWKSGDQGLQVDAQGLAALSVMENDGSRWSSGGRRGDGHEIYYLSEDRKLMAVAVGTGPSFAVPKMLFQTRVPEGVTSRRTHYVPEP